jgi:hypothetical protein
MMSNPPIPLLARAVLVITLGAAVPLAFAAAQDAPAPDAPRPVLKKTIKPKGIGSSPAEACKLVKQEVLRCEPNAYGDNVCTTETIEVCLKPE